MLNDNIDYEVFFLKQVSFNNVYELIIQLNKTN